MTGIVDGVLRFGRAFAEANLFRDRCRVIRLEKRVWIPETGRYEDRETTLIPELPCRVKNPYRAPTTAAAEGQTQEMSMAMLQCPVDRSTGIRAHDIVEITSSASDPDLVGMRYKVSVRKGESDSTMRRIPLMDAN